MVNNSSQDWSSTSKGAELRPASNTSRTEESSPTAKITSAIATRALTESNQAKESEATQRLSINAKLKINPTNRGGAASGAKTATPAVPKINDILFNDEKYSFSISADGTVTVMDNDTKKEHRLLDITSNTDWRHFTVSDDLKEVFRPMIIYAACTNYPTPEGESSQPPLEEMDTEHMERYAAQAYMDVDRSHYSQMNTLLRTGKLEKMFSRQTLKAETAVKVLTHIAFATSFLNKRGNLAHPKRSGPEFSANGMLYRGTTCNPEIEKFLTTECKKGTTFTENGFCSTSFGGGYSRDVTYIIATAPVGTGARDVMDYAFNPLEEKEVLFGPNTMFEVLDDPAYDEANKSWTVYLKEVVD